MNPKNRKLTEEQVRDIYSGRGALTLKARAAKYNVSDVLISHIDTGKAWSRVTGAVKPSSPPRPSRSY